MPSHYSVIVTIYCSGGYYYQVPEKGMNMEDTLLTEYSYAQQHGIPYR
jgi:hypothetical protein